MMMSPLTGWRGRVAALAIAALLFVVIGTGVIAPLTALYAERAARIEERTRLANHMARVVADLPSLQADAARLADGQTTLIAGTTDTVAAATLQMIVQSVARRDGIELTAIETAQPLAAGPYWRIGLKLSTAGSWAALVQFLASIEHSQTPTLAIDMLDIRRAGNSDSPDELSASLAVHAFRAASSGTAR